MEVLAPFRKFAAAAWRHPGRSAVGAGLLAWLVNPFNYFPSPVVVMRGVLDRALGPDWTMAEVVAWWGFDLLVLLLALALIWWVGRSAIQEERRQGALERELLTKEEAARDKALEIPKRLVAYYSFHRDIVLLDDAIANIEHRIKVYKRRSSRWLGNGSFRFDNVTKKSELTGDGVAELTRPERFRHFTPPVFKSALPTESIVAERVVENGVSTDFFLYIPAANGPFRNALDNHIKAMDTYHAELIPFRNRQYAELEKLDEVIRKAAANG